MLDHGQHVYVVNILTYTYAWLIIKKNHKTTKFLILLKNIVSDTNVRKLNLLKYSAKSSLTLNI
jgi:hypothetical protein